MSVKTVRYEAGFDDLLDSQQDLVTVVKEIGSAEGPSWNPLTQALLFCSVVPEKLCRWSPREGFSIVRSDSNIAAGTCYDAQWRIVCCEQTTHRIVRMHDDGSGYEVMASHYADLELNGPNDLAVHSDGGIYFSDPNFSRRATVISAMSQTPQPLQGLYRIDPICFNLCFGGSDLRQLFLCCLDALYSVRLKVPGAHLLPGVSRAAL